MSMFINDWVINKVQFWNTVTEYLINYFIVDTWKRI